MTHDRSLPRSASKSSLSTSVDPKRDDRYSWLLYLLGGWSLVVGAMLLFLGVFLIGVTGAEPTDDGSRPLMMLVIIYGLYRTILGLSVLGRLRAAWVLLVLTHVIGLLIKLLTLGVASIATLAQQLDTTAGFSLLGGSYVRAAWSVGVLIFLLGRKNWFYR